MGSTSLGFPSDRHRHSRTCGRRGSRLGLRVRRVLGVAVAVPVLAVSLVSCSGGGDGGGDGGGGKGKDGQGQQSSGGSGEDSGGGEGSDASLNEKQLKSALLKSGDVKGYRTQRNKEDALPPQNALDSDDPRCSAITDAIDSEPEHARTAYTSGVLLKGALGRGAALQQVLLSAYEEGEAAEWLGELKKALKVCDSFTGKVGPGEKTRLRVSPREGAGVGDDSVQFTMRDAKQQDSPTVFTIVRTGGSTSSFMSVSLTGKPQPVEKALVEKQHEKLKAAAKN